MKPLLTMFFFTTLAPGHAFQIAAWNAFSTGVITNCVLLPRPFALPYSGDGIEITQVGDTIVIKSGTNSPAPASVTNLRVVE